MPSPRPSSRRTSPRALLSLLLILVAAGCTVLDDPEALAPDCDLDDAVCLPGTTRHDFSQASAYGVCDIGTTDARYLRDISQEIIGTCVGDSDCGYICLEDEEVICEGVEDLDCPAGFRPVSPGEVPEACDSDDVVRDDRGEIIALCRVQGGCEYLCFKDVECRFGQDSATGACNPGPNCTASSLSCADGTCLSGTLVEQICEDEASAPEEIEVCAAAVACVFERQPPLSCTEQQIEQFTPSPQVLAACGLIFCCPDDPSTCGEPDEMLCDGVTHCADGSDEMDCQESACPSGSLPCLSSQGFEQTCFSEHDLCDGEMLCNSGFDESDGPLCTAECYKEFACTNGTVCVPFAFMCDGEDDCGDNSDEDLPSCFLEGPTRP